MSKPDLNVKIAGITFRNPVLTAAGPPSRSGEALLAAARGGAGGLVAKTISTKPAPVPRPNMMAMDRGRLVVCSFFNAANSAHIVTRTDLAIGKGFLNTELWSELPPEEWLQKEYAIAKSSGLPLIASVGYSPEELIKLAPLVAKAGADAIEFSTHYVDARAISRITRTLKSRLAIPVFCKLSPHNPETIVAQARAAERAGADAIVAVNSLGPTLSINVETGQPVLGSRFGFGWMSGPPLKPLALRCVFDIARSVKIPVIGVGGITCGRDAVEHIMVGASAVQVCTAAIFEGPSAFGRITKEIAEFMSTHGYENVKDFQGLYIKNIKDGQDVRTAGGRATVNRELCKGCRTCSRVCAYGAISSNGDITSIEPPTIDARKCFACGLCTTICPTGALSLTWNAD